MTVESPTTCGRIHVASSTCTQKDTAAGSSVPIPSCPWDSVSPREGEEEEGVE